MSSTVILRFVVLPAVFSTVSPDVCWRALMFLYDSMCICGGSSFVVIQATILSAIGFCAVVFCYFHAAQCLAFLGSCKLCGFLELKGRADIC